MFFLPSLYKHLYVNLCVQNHNQERKQETEKKKKIAMRLHAKRAFQWLE